MEKPKWKEHYYPASDIFNQWLHKMAECLDRGTLKETSIYLNNDGTADMTVTVGQEHA